MSKIKELLENDRDTYIQRQEATAFYNGLEEEWQWITKLEKERNNDGLLANHIAQAEKTSYEYAISAIQYEVFNWRKALQENGLFAIKNVGDFSLNADKNLIFTPYDQTNYLSNSFGLAPFVSPKVKRELFEQKIEALEDENVISLIPERRKTSAYLKYAAIFVLGLGLTGAVVYPIYQPAT